MLRWLIFFGVIGAVGTGIAIYWLGGPPAIPSGLTGNRARAEDQAPPSDPAGPPPSAGAPEAVEVPVRQQPIATPLVVIPDGRICPINVQQVPSLREGQILVIGTPVRRDEAPPPGREDDYVSEVISYLITERDNQEGSDGAQLIPITVNGDKKYYSRLKKNEPVRPGKIKLHPENFLFRRLREGDEVREGQLLTVIDPAIPSAELDIKIAKLAQAEADRIATEKTRDESRERVATAKKLLAVGGNSLEDYRGALLTFDRYISELSSKTDQVDVQIKELRQAETIVEQHFIRSKITGQVKNILKHRGEAVRAGGAILDPIMILQDNRRLRIESRVDYQYRRHLKIGDRVAVEPTQAISPDMVLIGHMQEITSVAVSRHGEIVSGSKDWTARVWNRQADRERLQLKHPAEVRALACSPVANLCLTGAADGIGRLWNLDKVSERAVELKDGHRGPINCVAFSPDGRWCATGGGDRGEICLWEVGESKPPVRFPADKSHRGGVTSVQFLPGSKDLAYWLVSAGRGDQTLLAWPIGADGNPGSPKNLGRRGGNISVLGVNATGSQVLFDQGKELKVLSLPDGALAGVLASHGATSFSTMALFSPDGKLILTAGGSDGRLQLWRGPTPKKRGFELRHLVCPGDAVTCGAFAPDGSFLVTGTRDQAVLVWPVPSKQEIDTQFTAELVLVEKDLGLGSRQVRVHAELDNRWFELTSQAVADLRAERVPEAVLERLPPLLGKEFPSEAEFKKALLALFRPDDLKKYETQLVSRAEKAGPLLLPGNTATLVVYPK